MICVLGIDAGGTKTVCLLADGDGTILAEARGGGANLQADGELAVEKVLHRVMEDALGDRGLMPAAICLGLAGVDREDDARVIRGIMARIGYKARVLVVNDALVALEAGVGGAPGIVIIAGTGSIVYGRNAAGEAARAGGWGYVLGDEGSGYWMGRLALRAVVREADRRGRATALTPRVLAYFGAARPPDLVHAVYARGQRPAALAGLAAEVQAAAADGDLVARQIIEAGAQALVSAAESVALRLGLSDEAFTFVLSGGIFRGVPLLADEVARRLPVVAPRAEVRPLAGEPAEGAVRLALAEARGAAVVPVYTSS
jgi:N-acetylglucosamine kinase-like BadF-type ATPase